MTRSSRLLAPILAGVVALALASCSVPVPEPSLTPSLEERGALLEHQAERIAQLTEAEVAGADEARDTGLFGLRVGDPSRRIRAVEYTVAGAGGEAPEVLTGPFQAFYSTDSESWPRVLVGVTSEGDSRETPVVLAWVQDGIQDPYELRAWAAMAPGGILPAMPRPEVGTALLPLDAEGFTVTPAEVIEGYVALLNGGEGEEATFAPDPFREGMFKAREALRKSAQGRGGTYTDTVTARLDESFALADAEGGALVFVRLEVVSDFTVPGAQLTLPATGKALLEGTLTSRVVHRYEDLVVIRIWAEGVSVLPSVVAAGHHLVRVSTS